MDTTELLEAAATGILCFGAAGAWSLLAYNLSQSTFFRKKIKSQEELAHIVDVEARKLGLDHSKIDVKYDEGGVEQLMREKEGKDINYISQMII